MVQLASYLGRVLFSSYKWPYCARSQTPSVLENEVDDTLSLFKKKTRLLHQR